MHKFLPGLVCALVVCQAYALHRLKIENADSPDAKFVLEAIATSDDTCRVDVRSKADGKVAAHITIKDFYTDDQRYSIRVEWRQDSAAFALNIDKGTHTTYSRVFVEDHGSWKEAALPEKQIAKLRREGKEEGGKAVDYLFVSAWLPNDQLKFSYTGTSLAEYEFIGRVVRTGRPRVDFVKMIPPKVEPEPKFDYENYTFSVLAGGTEGSKDGKGTIAQFKWPHGLSIDARGNVFVADRGNDLVRKISRDGIVTTLAGSPEKYGDADGAGAAARFRYPVATAVDASGNIYLADSSNNLIRKITPGGVVSTLAGSFSLGGYADGKEKAAQFHDPNGVAVDTSGNVFVADAGNHVIRKIASDGQVTTFAGSAGQEGMVDGEAKSARFAFPRDVALDREGNLYVADKSAVRKIDSHGMVSTVAGSPDQAINIDGPVGAARFSNPLSVAVGPAGNVYVVDDKNIRKITPGGVVKTIRDSSRRTPFVRPSSIAVDEKQQIYVADEDGFSILIGKLAK